MTGPGGPLRPGLPEGAKPALRQFLQLLQGVVCFFGATELGYCI